MTIGAILALLLAVPGDREWAVRRVTQHAASEPGAWPGQGAPTETAYNINAARPGDLIFRRGLGVLSRAVVAVQRGGRFSHVGIVVFGSRGVEVIHALPASEGEPGGLRREALSRFVATENSRYARLFRVRDATRQERLRAVRAAEELYRRAPPFDGSFSLETVDRIYCTELVWRAWLTAGVEIAAGRTPRLALLGTERHVLMPDDLTAHPRLAEVRLFQTQPGGEP